MKTLFVFIIGLLLIVEVFGGFPFPNLPNLLPKRTRTALPDKLSTNDETNILNSINTIRKGYCLPNLKFSSMLGNNAFNEIKSCSIPKPKAGFTFFTSSEKTDVSFGSLIAKGEPVSSWKSISSNYRCPFDDCTGVSDTSFCNPYRQIIFGQETEIGCAAVKCKGTTTYRYQFACAFSKSIPSTSDTKLLSPSGRCNGDCSSSQQSTPVDLSKPTPLSDSLTGADEVQFLTSFNDIRKSLCLSPITTTSDLIKKANDEINKCQNLKPKAGFLFFVSPDTSNVPLSSIVPQSTTFWKGLGSKWACANDTCRDRTNPQSCVPYRQIIFGQATQVGCSAVKCGYGSSNTYSYHVSCAFDKNVNQNSDKTLLNPSGSCNCVKKTDAPKPSEAPKPKTEPPKPKTEPPKPSEAPKPKTEPPKPKTEPPKPTEKPKPSEAPKPKTEPPKPKTEPPKPTEKPKPSEAPKPKSTDKPKAPAPAPAAPAPAQTPPKAPAPAPPAVPAPAPPKAPAPAPAKPEVPAPAPPSPAVPAPAPPSPVVPAPAPPAPEAPAPAPPAQVESVPGPVPAPTSTFNIKMTLNYDISTFTSSVQQTFLESLSKVMNCPVSQLKITNVQAGSVVADIQAFATQDQINSLSQSNLAALGVTSFSVASPRSAALSPAASSPSPTPFYLTTAFLVGVTIGGFLLVVLIVVIIALLVRAKRKRRGTNPPKYVDLEEYSEAGEEEEEEAPKYVAYTNYF